MSPAGSRPRFRLDLSDERLWHGNKAVPLTRKPFFMLRCFVRHPNRLLTKEALLEQVWPDTVVTEGCVKDYVQILRRALGDDPRHPRFLQTVRGRGYRYLGGIEVTGEDRAKIFGAPNDDAVATILVLPFVNRSSDPKLDYFADGLTEDLITALSKVRALSVLHCGAAALWGRPAAAQVTAKARSLGAGYLLEGSIRRSGERLRCTAQLVDAGRGRHLWAERYDLASEDVFALQDEIVRRLLIELQVRFSEGDFARTSSRGTASLDAWLLRLQGRAELNRVTPEGTVRARAFFKAASEADPDWAGAVGGLAFCHYCDARYGWSASREDSIALGAELAERAVAMDPEDPGGYLVLRGLSLLQGKPRRALALAEKAVSLAPNDYAAVGLLAATLTYLDEAPRALKVFERATRLAPTLPRWFYRMQGMAYHLAGRTEPALETLEALARREPDWCQGLAQLAAAYVSAGRQAAAEAATQRILELDPTYSAARELALVSFPGKRRTAWLRRLLIRAGLPEKAAAAEARRGKKPSLEPWHRD